MQLDEAVGMENMGSNPTQTSQCKRLLSIHNDVVYDITDDLQIITLMMV